MIGWQRGNTIITLIFDFFSLPFVELPETPATSQTPGNKVSTHTLIQTIPGNTKSPTKNQ